tara:strand:- start:180 stop:890 length:711 start_codon:yes stop_codon:yes gene_type:complete
MLAGLYVKEFKQQISNWNLIKIKNKNEIFDLTDEDKEIYTKLEEDEERYADLLAKSSGFESTEELTENLQTKIFENDDFTNTIKFTEELKKYIDSHNDTAVIEVFPSNGGVWEEYIHTGSWNNKNFEMKVIIPLKNADYQYDGSLSDFIEEIGTKKITELDDSNLNIELLGDSGGSFEVDEITWSPELTDEEENEVDEYNLVDFGIDYDDDDFIFEKGCIYEIKVTIDDEIIKLVK